MLFYTTFARRTFTVSLNELFENYTGRHTHVYSGRMTRLKYPTCSRGVILFFLNLAKLKSNVTDGSNNSIFLDIQRVPLNSGEKLNFTYRC